MAKYCDRKVGNVRFPNEIDHHRCISYKIPLDQVGLVGQAPLEELKPIEPPQEFNPTFQQQELALNNRRLHPAARKKLQIAIEAETSFRGSGR